MSVARQINMLNQYSPIYNELYNKISINNQTNQPNLNQILNQFIWKIEIENSVHIHEPENQN